MVYQPGQVRRAADPQPDLVEDVPGAESQVAPQAEDVRARGRGSDGKDFERQRRPRGADGLQAEAAAERAESRPAAGPEDEGPEGCLSGAEEDGPAQARPQDPGLPAPGLVPLRVVPHGLPRARDYIRTASGCQGGGRPIDSPAEGT